MGSVAAKATRPGRPARQFVAVVGQVQVTRLVLPRVTSPLLGKLLWGLDVLVKAPSPVSPAGQDILGPASLKPLGAAGARRSAILGVGVKAFTTPRLPLLLVIASRRMSPIAGLGTALAVFGRVRLAANTRPVSGPTSRAPNGPSLIGAPPSPVSVILLRLVAAVLGEVGVGYLKDNSADRLLGRQVRTCRVVGKERRRRDCLLRD